MAKIDELIEVVRRLRGEDGCPWDKVQTHESLKPELIEEACEVLSGINVLKDTGNGESLKEELGDLLLQIVFHASLAEDEGLFTFDDVAETVKQKMIVRHPHVFGEVHVDGVEDVLTNWEDIKRSQKKGKEWMDEKLPEAFEEAKGLIEKAKERKGYK